MQEQLAVLIKDNIICLYVHRQTDRLSEKEGERNKYPLEEKIDLGWFFLFFVLKIFFF